MIIKTLERLVYVILWLVRTKIHHTPRPIDQGLPNARQMAMQSSTHC